MRENTFPGFNHKAEELSAYILSIGIFIIGLKNERVICFEPKEVEAFAAWLRHHKIREITNSVIS